MIAAVVTFAPIASHELVEIPADSRLAVLVDGVLVIVPGPNKGPLAGLIETKPDNKELTLLAKVTGGLSAWLLSTGDRFATAGV